MLADLFGSTTPSTITLQQGGISTQTPLGSSNGGGFTVIQSGPSVFSILADVLSVVAVLAFVGLFVIIIIANRADPDPSGRRPQAVYFFAVSFVTLLTSVVGSSMVVFALVQLIGHHPGGGSHSVADSVARTATLGGLVTVVSLALLIVHLRRGMDLVRSSTEPISPTRRVAQSYVSGVGFLAIIALLVVTVLAVYLLFAIAGPGVFGSFGGRVPSLRYLIDAVYVGAVAVAILRTHRNLVSPGLHFFRASDGAGFSGRHASPADTAASASTLD